MNIDFKKILLDYENLIGTTVKIPLNNNQIINFQFRLTNLPHLIGLNHLTDIPILADYQNDHISAKEIFLGIKYDSINTEDFKNSKEYPTIYENKLRHFSSNNIIRLLKNASIKKFDPANVPFPTKLDKVDYMIFEMITCNNKLNHLGIGVSNSTENFPNTFFARNNNDYLIKQDDVYPTSIFIKDKKKHIFFKINWNNVRKSLSKSSHYKALVKLQDKYHFNIETITKDDLNSYNSIDNTNDRDSINRHFKLLRLDEVKEVYKPYLDSHLWNNLQKQYLIDIIDSHNKDYLPNEITKLLNEYK